MYTYNAHLDFIICTYKRNHVNISVILMFYTAHMCYFKKMWHK